MNSQLYHHGIKGQKWGVRRFQNKDGTRTEAGKRRDSANGVRKVGAAVGLAGGIIGGVAGGVAAGRHIVKSSSGAKNAEDRQKILKDQQKSVKNAVSGAKEATSGVKKLADVAVDQPRNRYNKRKNLTQEEMDKMSDESLRKLVNRLNLEQQYSMLTADNTAHSRVQRGIEYAEATLSIIGGVATIAVPFMLMNGK